jgi:hypothetical protein
MSNITGRKVLLLLHQEASSIVEHGSRQRAPRYRVLKAQWEALKKEYYLGDAQRDGLAGIFSELNHLMNVLHKEFGNSDED